MQGIGALAEKLPRADRSATADFPAPRSEAYRFVERPVVREIFAEALFGDKHPYGISYPEKDYDTLTRADLESLYRRLYTYQQPIRIKLVS